jgi:hypothetical protein
MFSFLRQSLSILLLFTLVAVPALPQSAPEPGHIVSLEDIQQSILADSQARQANIAKIESFLATEPARKTLHAMKMDSAQINQAISVLSDEELSRLAAQSEKVKKDVIAGDRGKRRLLKYVILGAATTVIVWLIVSHRAT